MIVRKSDKYINGSSGIRAVLGDKDRAIEFEECNNIVITLDEFEVLNELGWIEVIDNSEITDIIDNSEITDIIEEDENG